MKNVQLFAMLACGLTAVLPTGRLVAATVLTSRTDLRRTTDTDANKQIPACTLIRTVTDKRQTAKVVIHGLGGNQYALFLYPCPNFSDNTNCLVENIALLNQINPRKGDWFRLLTGSAAAPPEFQDLGVTNLTDLTAQAITVAYPGLPSLLTTVTNILGGCTNIVGGVTNIFGNMTNVTFGIPVPMVGQTGQVFATMWAPLRPMSKTPGKAGFNRKNALALPANGQTPPSPKAAGSVRVMFNGALGRSYLQVIGRSLIRGQTYTVFIADSVSTTNFNYLPAGEMTAIKDTATAVLVRNTGFGQPLPQQVGDIGELSGRRIVIMDGFYQTHLEGVIP